MTRMLVALLLLSACSAREPAGEASNQQETANVQAPPAPSGPEEPAPAPPPGNGTAGPETEGGTLRTRVEAAPPDVRDALERRAGCNHFSGEDPYDADRRAQIEAALREARCDTIERDIAALRTRYARDAAILRLLDDSVDIQPW